MVQEFQQLRPYRAAGQEPHRLIRQLPLHDAAADGAVDEAVDGHRHLETRLARRRSAAFRDQ